MDVKVNYSNFQIDSAENSTFNHQKDFDQNNIQFVLVLWYFLAVVSSVCLFLTLYLLLCVVVFIKRSSFNMKRSNSVIQVRQQRSGSAGETLNEMATPKRASRSRKIDSSSTTAARWMHFVLLITLLLSLGRSIIEILLFFYAGNSSHACDVLAKVMIGFTAFAIHGCVVFMWLRQYVFYTNRWLKNLCSKKLKAISYFTYFEMVTTVLACLVLHIWWRDYVATNGYCRPQKGSRRLSAFVPYGILALSTVTIQIFLTFLFVYPIVKHNKQMKQYKDSQTVQNEEFNSKSSKSRTRLIECVKRTLVGTTIAITTDVAGAIVAIWLPEEMPLFVLSFLYEVDILLNIFCLFYTYVDWRNMISPWKVIFCRV